MSERLWSLDLWAMQWAGMKRLLVLLMCPGSQELIAPVLWVFYSNQSRRGEFWEPFCLLLLRAWQRLEEYRWRPRIRASQRVTSASSRSLSLIVIDSLDCLAGNDIKYAAFDLSFLLTVLSTVLRGELGLYDVVMTRSVQSALAQAVFWLEAQGRGSTVRLESYLINHTEGAAVASNILTLSQTKTRHKLHSVPVLCHLSKFCGSYGYEYDTE